MENVETTVKPELTENQDPSELQEKLEIPDNVVIRETPVSWDSKERSDQEARKVPVVYLVIWESKVALDPKEPLAQLDQPDLQVSRDQWDHQDEKDLPEMLDQKDSTAKMDDKDHQDLQDPQVCQDHPCFHRGWEEVWLMVILRDQMKEKFLQAQKKENNHRPKKKLQSIHSPVFTDTILATRRETPLWMI